MFQLDPDLEAFRQDIRKTAERAFAAKAAYWDEQEEFPTENRDLLARLGYLGMVNEVLADDQLDARALDFARELAESATFALAMGKRMFRASMQPSLEAFLDLEAHVQGLVLQSDDRKEGVAAFLAKRKANFVGH